MQAERSIDTPQKIPTAAAKPRIFVNSVAEANIFLDCLKRLDKSVKGRPLLEGPVLADRLKAGAPVANEDFEAESYREINPSSYQRCLDAVSSFVGAGIRDALLRHPPFVSVLPWWIFNRVSNPGCIGTFFSMSNHIILSSYLLNAGGEPEGTLVHELVHYASDLGSDSRISRYRRPLDEGATELYAFRIASGSGIGYCLTGRYLRYMDKVEELQDVIGRNELKKAYFTGNFSRISRMLKKMRITKFDSLLKEESVDRNVY